MISLTRFFCPPIGVIAGSFLSSVGHWQVFATIDKDSETIKAGCNLKNSKGVSSIDSSSEQQD